MERSLASKVSELEKQLKSAAMDKSNTCEWWELDDIPSEMSDFLCVNVHFRVLLVFHLILLAGLRRLLEYVNFELERKPTFLKESLISYSMPHSSISTK
jgi:hypothetical protein